MFLGHINGKSQLRVLTKYVLVFCSIMFGALFLASCSAKKDMLENTTTQAILTGDWKGAILHGTKWAAADPQNPVAHYLLNIAYAYTSNRDMAKVELSKAFGTQVDLLRVGKWTTALVDSHPRNPYAYLLKGIVHEISGSNSAAVHSYEQALEHDRDFTLAYASMGNLYLSSGQFDKAMEAYRAMLAIDPKDASVYVHIGTVHVMNNNVDEAIVSFEKACEIDDGDMVAYYNLGNAYLEKGLIEKARGAFKRVVELDPHGEVGRDAQAIVLQLSRGSKDGKRF